MGHHREGQRPLIPPPQGWASRERNEYHWKPPKLNGRELNIMEAIDIALQLNAGPPLALKPRCYACGADSAWKCVVQINVAGRTLGYAQLYHCVAHYPPQAGLLLGASPGVGEEAQVQRCDLVSPPETEAYRAAAGSHLPAVPAPPKLG